MGFNSPSLFSESKREAVTQGGTKVLYRCGIQSRVKDQKYGLTLSKMQKAGDSERRREIRSRKGIGVKEGGKKTDYGAQNK